jgi:molybdopterin molybdotransferase
MFELEEALARILAVLPKPGSETLSLREAHGRVLLDRVAAAVDLPPFDNSPVDGYAVRAADVAGVNPGAPARLRLVGRVPAGETFSGELTTGTCVRLFTGSPLPRGADAVVMQEETLIPADRPGEVLVLEPVRPWENVRFRGEDVKRGATLIEAGEVLSVGRMALLAAAGVNQVNVGRRPVAALLAAGSELKEPGETLAAGQIYESNRTGLASLIESAGAIVKVFPIVPDDLDAIREALGRALGECDLVITCGGVSVGEMDFIRSAFEQLGGELQFWKVAMKPGRPFTFGRCGSKWLFGLPGNPVSALVTFLLLARPALRRWQGAGVVGLPASPGVLVEPLANAGSRRHFMRVTMDAAGKIRSAGFQASHILSSFASANGLVDVAPQTDLPAGTIVQVLRWE